MESSKTEVKAVRGGMKWLWDMKRRERKIWKKMSIDERIAYMHKLFEQLAAQPKTDHDREIHYDDVPESDFKKSLLTLRPLYLSLFEPRT